MAEEPWISGYLKTKNVIPSTTTYKSVYDLIAAITPDGKKKTVEKASKVLRYLFFFNVDNSQWAQFLTLLSNDKVSVNVQRTAHYLIKYDPQPLPDLTLALKALEVESMSKKPLRQLNILRTFCIVIPEDDLAFTKMFNLISSILIKDNAQDKKSKKKKEQKESRALQIVCI